MSYFLADSTGPLTEFASIGGYSDFRSWAQTQSAPIRRFVHFGFTEDLKPLVEALRASHAPEELEVLKDLLLGCAEDAKDILVVSDGMSSDEELRAAAEAKKTLVHKAAESFERRFELAAVYAFAQGRRAIKHQKLYDAKTVEQASEAVAHASLAMRMVFSELLPGLVQRCLEAGGNAGLDILQGRFRTAGGKGSGNFGHAGRPGARGGSSQGLQEAVSRTFQHFANEDRKSLWIGQCVAFAERLQAEVGAGEVVAVRQDEPRTEYHTVFSWKGKFYDAKDIEGVSRIEDLKYWDHVNVKHEGPRKFVTYEPGKELRTAAPKKDDDIYEMRFDSKNPKAVKWARRHVAKLLDDLTVTTQHDIATAIIYGHETGDLRGQYRQILAAVGDKDRAQLISRNETMVVASKGQRLAWEQAVDRGLLDADVRREWITADLGACEACEDLNGETATLTGDYPKGGGEGPPKHVVCRCTEGIVGG